DNVLPLVLLILCSLCLTFIPVHLDICLLMKDGGDCQSYTIKWFFDHKRSTCSRFWYGGCGGNKNLTLFNFFSRNFSAPPFCRFGFSIGDSWFFDTNIGACSPFWYGGCSGNANRFIQTAHRPQTEPVHVSVEPLTSDQGDCENYTMMWFFDTKQKACARFWYGGCGGNKNRFVTQEEFLRHAALLFAVDLLQRRQGSKVGLQRAASVCVHV
uniref:BPTI/Kunitz inhibitor domain-containing protein n=1 Tax=Amphilophus citrinellus TaxID=61819 RepID=A0A3Q0T2G7_AMPCI